MALTSAKEESTGTVLSHLGDVLYARMQELQRE